MKKSITLIGFILIMLAFSCKNNNQKNQSTSEYEQKNEQTEEIIQETEITETKTNTLSDILASVPEKKPNITISLEELENLAENDGVSIESPDFFDYFDESFRENMSNFKALFNVKISNSTNILFFCANEFMFDDWNPINYYFVIIDGNGKICDCSYGFNFYDEVDEEIIKSVSITETNDGDLFFIKTFPSDIMRCLDTANMNLSQDEINELYFYKYSTKIIENKLQQKEYDIIEKNSTEFYSGTIGNDKVSFEITHNGYDFSGSIVFEDEKTYSFKSTDAVAPMCNTDAAILFENNKQVGDFDFITSDNKIYGQLTIDGENYVPMKLEIILE